MANQNQCNFTGRIGKLDIRYIPSNDIFIPFTTFSLAISKSRKDSNGQWIDDTTWINCKAFKQIAEYIEKHAQKGTFVRVTTAYQENKWTDKSGQQRISPEFLVNDVEILGNRKERKPQESQGRPNLSTANQPNSNAIHQADFEDEDIPF
ncbi:single-stranded DNA-binding protein (plasmid) [Arsenophonus nasoniae]|uniref:Single-stranded DNA-binding protein n=1 Tax=Arsenophonus nasoniae TaxID=638 RepID=A0A4P7KR31_9GAMM|nr:single-stranded DNA-binding protein [Arsenophonus nasoniae]QBY42507.1 Single-stranded DNA-binding protein [Arsenophonus nasoniae]WGM06616.1 single-stranded DNA-binding protein [Arsenophonus nasoniae]WGM09048.1 single-stranded DNA-binding protein [Arsenophonus nasoniae]WGM11556.1 single-stranded DNA-binding protein [Arsenophonus nasoniae]WGM13709.1 single-stranded DNA-binding protein [Arsenophonus nasoniae]